MMGSESYSISSIVNRVVVEVCIAFVASTSLLLNAINLWLAKGRLKKSQKMQDVEDSKLMPSKTGKISVIIATKNESRFIGQTIRNLESTTVDKSRVEIIIVDVGSMDNTLGIARASSGAIPVTFVRKRDIILGGRGSAINEGYAKSSGDIILILRADSLVPPHYDQILRNELSDPKILFAAFKFSVDYKALSSKVEPPGLWLLGMYFNLRSSLFWFPSPMQGLALSSHNFEHHQFSDDVIMDDVSFYSSIRTSCLSDNLEFKLLDQSVHCSPIRWEALGVLTWMFLDSTAHFLFSNLLFSPDAVYRVCYDFMPRLIKSCFRKK